MELKIGFHDSPRELAFEAKGEAADVASTVREALEKGSGLLTLTDTRDQEYFVRVETIAWVAVGSDARRAVGFGGA